MHRFFVPPNAITETEAIISGPDAEQIQRVLRLGIGDQIVVFDGTGRQCRAEISAVARSQANLRILSTEYPKTEASVRLVLAQCLLKGEKLEWVIQKCTEVGISSLTFLRSQRTIPEIPQSKILDKLSRWQRIAKEAAEQSGRVCVPEVSGPLDMPEFIRHQGALGPVLIPWENETTALSEALSTIKRAKPSMVTLIIGPEGGFCEEEVRLAREHGALSVSLGPRILRAETAAVVTTALVLHELEGVI